ncbi:C6 transcription factor [Penicillium herquei]|nr:C6 transcription factor [Penicillium herquei]
MPIIDLHELLGSFIGLTSTTISQLLFQCVLFAGVAFVDVLDLEAAGFNSRGEAHEYYFDKAQVGTPFLKLDRLMWHLTVPTQLLYDFDYERDPLILIQALAMMSHWNQKNKCHKDSLHWLESSLSLAFKYGLHREDLADVGSMGNNGLRKRIWWSLYSQSKIVSLGIRYPLRSVDQQAFNVSLPSLADFDFRGFPSTVLDLLHGCNIIRQIEEQEASARLFLQKIRICLLLDSRAKVDYESYLSPSGFHPPFEDHSSPATGSEYEALDPKILTETYSDKWYQPIKVEKRSVSASFLSLSPIDKAKKLYHLHLMLLKTFPHHSDC